VQRDSANRFGHTTIIVPFTDAAKTRQSIITPHYAKGNGGLTKDSIALCHQVRAVDRLRLRTRLGQLSDTALHTVDAGLSAILDLKIDK
jgi:mRNA interferase MazF